MFINLRRIFADWMKQFMDRLALTEMKADALDPTT